MQNDPKDIPLIINKLIHEDLDLVVGWRKQRKDNFFMRNLPSMIANNLIGMITKVKLNDYGCSLKRITLKYSRGKALWRNKFIPAWMATKIPPHKIDEVEVSHHPRIAGESKYGISRTFQYS